MIDQLRQWHRRVTSEAGAYEAVIRHTRRCPTCNNGRYCDLGARLERRWEKLQREEQEALRKDESSL